MTETASEALKMVDDYFSNGVDQKNEASPTTGVATPSTTFQHISQQQQSGTIKIAGCISSIDKWGRLHFVTPKSRWGRDTLNTSVILSSLNDKLKKGSSPVGWNSFTARSTPKSAFIVDGKSVDAKSAAGIPLELSLSYTEFEFPTRTGWSLTLLSAKSIKI